MRPDAARVDRSGSRRSGSGLSVADRTLTATDRVSPATPSSRWFLPLFALAWSGGSVAYVPFLTLLLPVRLSALAGSSDVGWLAASAVVGGVMASGSNILFGWASDRVGGRRVWMAGGLIATLLLTVVVARAGSAAALVGAVAAWQIALNMLLAPLAAWAADAVPDRRRGWLGGVFAVGPAIGAASGLLVVSPSLSGFGGRLAAVCGLVVLLVAPLLLFARSPGPLGERPAAVVRARLTRELALVWTARLLVQLAQATLFGFLFYILRALPDRPTTEREFSGLVAIVLFASVPLTFALAAIADRTGRRGAMLVATCLTMAVGLVVLSMAQDRAAAFAGYALFGLAAASFLALQSGYAMLLLPSPGRHGRDLGLLNLTNTLPNVASPLLAVALASADDFGPLLLVCAGLMLATAALVGRIRWSRGRWLPRNDSSATL